MQRKHYYAYIRVSTVKQGERGVSLQEQRDAIERYAQRNGLRIAEWFDEQETAAKRGRPVFGRMLKRLKKGVGHGVIIHKIDRSARNLKDWADLGELIDNGVEVHFANESLDLTSRGGRLSADIQAVVAADYIRNLREETRKGFYGRLKQGLYPLPAPIGYLDQGKGKAKTLDPVRAPLVRMLFEQYATGRHNLDTLVQEAERIGLTNRYGGHFSRSALAKLLNNSFYIGLITLESTKETYAGIHDALISPSLFERVQQILHGRTHTKCIVHDFLFRRLLSCRLCGRTPIGEHQKGQTYYRCHTRPCPTKCVREDNVEAEILELLRALQIDSSERRYVELRFGELQKDAHRSQEKAVQALRLQLSKTEGRLDRLTDALIDGLLDKEAYEQRKERLLREQKGIQHQIQVREEDPGSVLDRLFTKLELANGALQSYTIGIVDEKREMVKTVTSNRFIREKEVSVEPSWPFDLIAGRPKCVNGGPSRDVPRTWEPIIEKMIEAQNKKTT